jgi:putative ABC transport system ATP-binding protein
MKLLRQVSHEMGKAVVIVSHDLWVREVADKIYWLEDGRVRDVTEEQKAEELSRDATR